MKLYRGPSFYHILSTLWKSSRTASYAKPRFINFAHKHTIQSISLTLGFKLAVGYFPIEHLK